MRDLDTAQDYQDAKLMKESSAEAQAAIEHIRKTAERRLAQLLLARFLLLELLVQEALNSPGGATGEGPPPVMGAFTGTAQCDF